MEGLMDQTVIISRKTNQIISQYLRLKEGELQDDSHIIDDLGADSLALVELGFQISETFGVPMLDTSGDKLVFKHLVTYIIENMTADHFEIITRGDE
jgi:acyl carrier protein